MKIIEKITLIIYSNIMLILSIILCLLVFGWLDIGVVGNIVRNCITTDPGSKITLGVSIIFILLSIRCIFFDPSSKEESITTRVELDKENNVNIFANLVVSSNAVIKDLSAELQNKIKERVKKTTDLEVKEVNITVKKVASVQEQK